jgi:hypothetical protein
VSVGARGVRQVAKGRHGQSACGRSDRTLCGWRT